MKKKISIVTIFSLLLSLFIGVGYASAASDYASSVMSSAQGLQKNGSPVDVSRSDPSQTLGASDGVFYSLGYGGEIVLEFPVKGHGNLKIATQEVTGGTYPLEEADVWVSGDGISWTYIGTVSNEEGLDDGISEISIAEEICVKYVRIVDITDDSLHGDSTDGFDLDSVSFTYDEECLEEEEGNGDGNDVVRNYNHAKVRNNIHIMANTGGNYADGSYGGSGGSGGNIYNNDGDVDEVETGNGAEGGDASTGGEIMTGNASVNLGIENHINLNDTRIWREGTQDGNTRVINRNRAMLENNGTAAANTGDNMALGSYGGSGGSGGDVENSGGEVEESSTGSGAAGGNGSLGGLVQTGSSDIRANIVNRVNENITRIRR